MSVSRKHRTVLLIVGFVLGAIIMGVATGAIDFPDNTTPIDNGVEIGAPNGPDVTVYGSTNVSLDDPSEIFPFSNTFKLYTTDGNATFVSSGHTNVSVQKSEITGTYTNTTELDVSSNELTINPEDKAKISLQGDAQFANWTDYALDDETVDLVIGANSGSTDVTFYGLSQTNTKVTAVNKSTGKPLALASTDSNGDITFSISHSTQTILLQSGSQTNAPTQDNAAPVGNLQTEPSQLSVDVDDADFPSDSVDVTIKLDGSQVHTQTITSAQTITTSIPASGLTGGSHTWVVNTTDSYGNTRIESYSYAVPDVLYIRNETNASQLITTKVNAQILETDGDLVYQRNVSDGTINLTNLPVNQDLIAVLEPVQHYTDRVYYLRQGDIYEQQDTYLLNKTAYNFTEVRFTLNDPTGTFTEESILYISKPINQSGVEKFRTIHSDQFGTEGVTVELHEDRRFRVRIVAQDGTTQDLGPYRSDVSETVELSPSSPGVEYDLQEAQWGYGAELDNTTLTWSYYDNLNETDQLTLYVHERGDPSNKLAPNETYLNLGNASGQYILTANESKKEWVVNFIQDRNREKETFSTVVSNQESLFPTNLDAGWRNVIGAGMLILLAGSFSVLSVAVGGIVFGISAGILWYLGWLGGLTTGAAIVVYLLIAIVVYIYQGGRV